MAPKLPQRASATKQSAGTAATQSRKKTSATTALSKSSGLSTRAKNKQTHPGLPDAPNPRRSTEEVQAQKAQKQAEEIVKAKHALEALRTLAAFEEEQSRQDARTSSPVDDEEIPLAHVYRSSRSKPNEATSSRHSGGMSANEAIGQLAWPRL